MSERRLPRPRLRARVDVPELNAPDGVGAVLSEVTAGLRRLETQARDRVTHTVDLAVGDNVIVHRLGRRPLGANVSPTVAHASFAWAMTSSDERRATIEVLNTAQPRAGVEFY